ncbi:MAG TPA: hypothetical protein VGF99_01450, partial [Myxococcota bacterium]
LANAPATTPPGPAAMRAASSTSVPPTSVPPASAATQATSTPPTTVAPVPTPRAPTPRPVTQTMQAVSIPPTATSTPPARATTTTPPPTTAPPAAAPTATTATTASQKQTEAAALTAATTAQLNKGPEQPTRVDSARHLAFGLEQPPPQAAPAAPNAPAVVVDLPLADIAAKAHTGTQLLRTVDGQLVMPIHEVGYVRTDLLASLSGAFEIEVVNRRYRGKRTDSLFGGADAAVVALMGKGSCMLTLGELVPTSLSLASEEIYLVENAVLGFSAGLVWENGRLPSEADRDLDIVHLRGSGKIVLGSKKQIVALPVKADAPVLVHASRLVGWTGQLVPYRAALPGLPEPARRVPIVRFEGTGTVLSL